MFYLLGFAVAAAAFILLIGLAGRGPRPAEGKTNRSVTSPRAKNHRTAMDEVFEVEV